MGRIPLISDNDIAAASNAAGRVVDVHRELTAALGPGMTLGEVDRLVADTLRKLNARSCFLGYKVPRSPAFPSHACLSVNECVVHGTAASLDRPLKAGDVISVDIGVTFEEWIGDAAWTYAIAERSEAAQKLMDCGKESIRIGIEQLRPGVKLVEWARAVQTFVETESGFMLIRGLGGHGYGRKLHAPPFVSNVLPNNPLEWPDAGTACEPGMLLAVEPMLAVSTGGISQDANKWPIYTDDGSLSVHYEHDVLVTADGPRVLTAGLEELPDVVGG
ncbi:MAG: type I methionyl aminopeptidase [Planctomycetota bacterium]